MTPHRPPKSSPEQGSEDRVTGIFRLSRTDLPALRQAAAELKQAFFSVDLGSAKNVPGFIRALSRDLDFPDWFGGNLDALNDCLTDFSWRPAPGYVITLDGSEVLRANPTSFAVFNEVLASVVDAWQARNIPFRVFYLQDEPPPHRPARLLFRPAMTGYKRPVSVLVVIHTPELQILLLERALQTGYWQSVTGSQEDDETLIATAAREVEEETGISARESDFRDWQQINTFEIFSEWRYRYAPGVTYNTEHVFSLQIAAPRPITLAPDEHLNYVWLPWREAAEKCFSWSNRDAILMLPEKVARQPLAR